MIEQVNPSNLFAAVTMAQQLWPDAEKDELTTEFDTFRNNTDNIIYLYKYADDDYRGFIHLSLRREYVEGCLTSPVAYVEGIYVKRVYRRKGIAEKLLLAGEKWGREKGCREMASDCELTNIVSADFHKAVGFKEVNRIICFKKKI